jgi:hypothetical protein
MTDDEIHDKIDKDFGDLIEPRKRSPVERGVSCHACEPLDGDYIITGISTRPGQGIIGITVRQKWNSKLILLEKICEQDGN